MTGMHTILNTIQCSHVLHLSVHLLFMDKTYEKYLGI